MKAIIFNEHGTLDQVHMADVPEPAVGPEDVLIEIKAAALNRLDLWVLHGWPGLNLKLPHIMGSDGAGVIAKTGELVTGYAVGDRVAVNPTLSCGHCPTCLRGQDNMCVHFAILGEHVDGFYARYAAVPARNLLALPGHVPFATAAAASLVYLTAWHSLITKGKLQAHESVLIIGAGGGVNTAAIDIARFSGAKPIIVVGSTPEKLALAQALGADVTINRHEQNWGKTVFEQTGRKGVDLVVDNVGAATFPTALRSLSRGGRLLTVGSSSGPKIELDNRLIFGKHLSIIGSTMGTHDEYEEVMGLIFKGKLQPAIDSKWRFAEARSALQKMQDNATLGKLVLSL